MNGSPSVKVALFIRNGGSESPCRWFYVTGIYRSVGGCSRNIYISYLFIIIGIDKATLLIVNSVLKEIHSLI